MSENYFCLNTNKIEVLLLLGGNKPTLNAFSTTLSCEHISVLPNQPLTLMQFLRQISSNKYLLKQKHSNIDALSDHSRYRKMNAYTYIQQIRVL